ncbi:MAG: PD-(D/E)XK nuclease family protein [Rickettsiales bacterium]|jgi:inactivated superfamily I helicase|nr:PD-(D/E)XK nuclease family protein [Rickettsiales bacterium]
MENRVRIFCASNPAKLPEALWELIKRDSNDFSDHVIFLSSRRAVRVVEKMLVEKNGRSVLLPELVALGEGPEDLIDDSDVVPDRERIIVLAKLLTADANIRTVSNALPVARDLVRMQDYMENEGAARTDWQSIVDEKYAQHFRKKAEFLHIAGKVLPGIFSNKITAAQKRNIGIRKWTDCICGANRRKYIVCGSTASVPATSDLMAHIASLENGRIILPGKINRAEDDLDECNPYVSEKKFLDKIGVASEDVQVIDTGESAIDFFNGAFSNNTGSAFRLPPCISLIECARESEEAEVVAEIAARGRAQNKTVLVISPDVAGNQRCAAAFMRRGLAADFSSGIPGTMTAAGRAVLNLLDDWIESGDSSFAAEYRRKGFDLFGALSDAIENMQVRMSPPFQIDSDESAAVWSALEQASEILSRNKIILNLRDARAVIADVLSDVSVRAPMDDQAKILVLGTIESRMQTADIVILTGLNEGMFPGRGYENSWLPPHVSEKVGLPSPDRKVSLQALDFISLSCAGQVYWLRSKTSGGLQTTESRFLSRVRVAEQRAKSKEQSSVQDCSSEFCEPRSDDLLNAARARDNVPYEPLQRETPRPPADKSDVYVTELELLIHNPYAFYARHILGLRPKDDYWKEPDARDFGNLVHEVIECAAGWNADKIIAELDARAKKILSPENVLFHFWHKRFVQIAPAVEKMLANEKNASAEIKGQVFIAGRMVRAKADRIWDGGVLDIKTGAAPSKKQLLDGNMPQLPLETYIMQNNGFPIKRTERGNIIMQFLQLKNNDVRLIEYSDVDAQKMIDAAVQKVSELFGRYSNDYEPYEYRENSEPKYKEYDDLARIDD